MARLAERLHAVRVEARSPDRSVTLTVSGLAGITVELAADVAVTHTEASLARQVAAAARVALAGYQRAQADAIAEVVAEVEGAA
jgi:hypothetical protein